MKQSHKTILLWVLLIGVSFVIYDVPADGGDSKDVPFFQMIDDVEQRRIVGADGIAIDLKTNRYDYVVAGMRDGKEIKVRWVG